MAILFSQDSNTSGNNFKVTTMNPNQPRVVMVTGATSGIGRAVANRFAAAGEQVIAIGRNASVLEAVAGDLNAHGGNSRTLSLDVTNEAEVQASVEQAIAAAGRLDVVVNAAGHIASGSIENT